MDGQNELEELKELKDDAPYPFFRHLPYAALQSTALSAYHHTPMTVAAIFMI
jgi:hypothetical protein